MADFSFEFTAARPFHPRPYIIGLLLKNKTRENWNLRDRQFLRRTKGNEIVNEKQNIVEIKIYDYKLFKWYENYSDGQINCRSARVFNFQFCLNRGAPSLVIK